VELVVGDSVVCPDCGEGGRVSLKMMKKHYYVVVEHGDRECVIAPAPLGEETRRVRVTRMGGKWTARRRAWCPMCKRWGSTAIVSGWVGKCKFLELAVNHGNGVLHALVRVEGWREVDKTEGAGTETEAGRAGDGGSSDAVEPPRLKHVIPLPPKLDNVCWYVVKLAASWGSLRENPTEENFQQLAKICEQVEERLGVPTEDVIAAADYYRKAPSGEARGFVNETVKQVCAQILLKHAREICEETAELETGDGRS
jgi:hypothetical protein